MTAGVFWHDALMLNEYINKNRERKPSEGASVSKNEKGVFYRAVLNTCLSFSNEVKNLGKEYGC